MNSNTARKLAPQFNIDNRSSVIAATVCMFKYPRTVRNPCVHVYLYKFQHCTRERK